jgi:hypothetical protein
MDLDGTGMGGGIFLGAGTSLSITDTILWNNSAETGPEIWMGTSSYPSTLTIDCSDVKDGQGSVHVDPGCILNWGPGVIDVDPRFVTGPNGYYYLSQVVAGQGSDSPCVDTGSDLSSNLGMDAYWTRTDAGYDSGTVDMGFHYGAFSSIWTVPLYQDTYLIHENTGGLSILFLNAGIDNASRIYVMLGSISGTEPGIPLPGGQSTLPLNWDFFTNIVINMINSFFFQNFAGVLDADGLGTAIFILPADSGATGLSMYYAYCLKGPCDFVSNPIVIEIVP